MTTENIIKYLSSNRYKSLILIGKLYDYPTANKNEKTEINGCIQGSELELVNLIEELKSRFSKYIEN